MTKKVPSSILSVTSFTAAKDPNVFDTVSSLISAMRLFRKMADDHEAQRPSEDRDGRVAVEVEGERLHQHHDAESDERHGNGLRGSAAKPSRPSPQLAVGRAGHLRTAPKVIPRSRWRRSRIVKAKIGMKNRVVPAATAGQSCPPSPMMKGMKGGIVWASPLVSSTAKAYSFQEKIRQKIAVAAIPVEACGSTTFQKAWRRV